MILLRESAVFKTAIVFSGSVSESSVEGLLPLDSSTLKVFVLTDPAGWVDKYFEEVVELMLLEDPLLLLAALSSFEEEVTDQV